jgi:cytidine deaminase
MMEFCNPNEFRIICATSVDNYVERTLKELLPNGFGASNLDK